MIVPFNVLIWLQTNLIFVILHRMVHKILSIYMQLRESELRADKAFQQHQVCEMLLYGTHDSTKTINKLKTHAGP